jgi:hypothetical protein
MDQFKQLLAHLDTFQLGELHQVQAYVNELITQLEAQQGQPTPAADTASYEAYRQMKAEAPDDLDEK